MSFIQIPLFIIAIILPLAFSAGASVGSARYDIKDLEVLEKQDNYEEFLKHARDIRPSQRKKQWREMVHNMATGYIDFKFKKRTYDYETFQFIEKLVLWPTLRIDEFFIIKRSRYGLQYLTKCISNSETKAQCLGDIHSFWHSAKQTPELAWNLSQLLKQANTKADLWKFTKVILRSDVSEFYCQRPSIQYQVFDQLLQMVKLDDSSQNTIAIIDKMMNNSCWKKISPSFTISLFSDDSSARRLSYKVLSAKKAINTETSDQYLTYYVLNGPVVGPLFNKAWNIINEVGQNYNRRQKLITKLMSMDPLPGKIFAHPNEKKRKTIIRFLSRNIPEYIDYYAKSCVNYLKGNGKFPTGNPTIECPQLFEVSKGTKWIKQDLQFNYSAIKRP